MTTTVQFPAVLTEVQRDLIGQALADAISHRRPGDDCRDCDEQDGLCPDHADDLLRAGAYRMLARDLGAEVPA